MCIYSVTCTSFPSLVSSKLIPNKKYGCPDINPLIRCIWNYQQCNIETNESCVQSKICCPTECGSSCKVPTYIKPSPIEGCPSYNADIRCIWFNEQCNDSDKLCPAGSICCGDNCGTFCVNQKKQCKCKPNPVKGCPAIDSSVQCIWFNEQCNETDKPCGAGSICCANSCGTSCIRQ